MRTPSPVELAQRVFVALRGAVPSHTLEEKQQAPCAFERAPQRKSSWERLRRTSSKFSLHRTSSKSKDNGSSDKARALKKSKSGSKGATTAPAPTRESELTNNPSPLSQHFQAVGASNSNNGDRETKKIMVCRNTSTLESCAIVPGKHYSCPTPGSINLLPHSDDAIVPQSQPTRRGVRFSSQPATIIRYEADSDPTTEIGQEPRQRRAVTKSKNHHAQFIRAAPQSHEDLSSAFDMLDNYMTHVRARSI